YPEVITALLEIGCEINKKFIINEFSGSPLGYAVHLYRPEVVKRLLSYGADTEAEIVNSHFHKGFRSTPLAYSLAIFNKNKHRKEECFEIVKSLLHYHANPNIQKFSTIINASGKGLFDIVKLLIDHGADPFLNSQAIF